MTVDDSGASRGSDDSSALIADCVARCRQLARASDAERDLRWYVAAYYVGDLGALASARLRSV